MTTNQSKLNWKCFKTNPPYDAYEDEKNGLETDYEYAYFLYRYKHRPHLNNKFILSHAACKFINGIFEGYQSKMETSPYPEDRIEVISWVLRDEVNRLLEADGVRNLPVTTQPSLWTTNDNGNAPSLLAALQQVESELIDVGMEVPGYVTEAIIKAE